jgi:hypothetical protein
MGWWPLCTDAFDSGRQDGLAGTLDRAGKPAEH